MGKTSLEQMEEGMGCMIWISFVIMAIVWLLMRLFGGIGNPLDSVWWLFVGGGFCFGFFMWLFVPLVQDAGLAELWVTFEWSFKNFMIWLLIGQGFGLAMYVAFSTLFFLDIM